MNIKVRRVPDALSVKEAKIIPAERGCLRTELVYDAFKLFEKSIHLAHFQMDYLTQDAALKLLKHLIAMHRLMLKQSQYSVFSRLTDMHTYD